MFIAAPTCSILLSNPSHTETPLRGISRINLYLNVYMYRQSNNDFVPARSARHQIFHSSSLLTNDLRSKRSSSPLSTSGANSFSSNQRYRSPAKSGSQSPYYRSRESTPIAKHTRVELEDFDSGDYLPGIKLPIPTRSMQTQIAPRMPKKAQRASSKRAEKRGERKASVRKEKYEDLDNDSDLTEVPSSDEDENVMQERRRKQKGKARSTDSLDSDLDSELEAKLLAAADGESLLGSGESGEDNESEEERFIIQDAIQREAKAKARSKRGFKREDDGAGGRDKGNSHEWERKGDGEYKARASAIHSGALSNTDTSGDITTNVNGGGEGGRDDRANEAEADEETEDPDGDDVVSLSPHTMRAYGLPVIEDELFAEQEVFNSSSEPSFTDFFESSDEDAGALADGARSDDDETTTDDDTDEDISDLEGGVLDAPLLAHVGSTEGVQGTEQNADLATIATGQEVPLLVIEDLDGRLIYARAGDGEAVFGSDGEFEFVDDSDDDSSDMEFGVDGQWRSWNSLGSGAAADYDDDGDTTDELPDEDMPYPRLLVGSIAPRGGRNARRARALAAKSRRLSPSARSGRAGGEASTTTRSSPIGFEATGPEIAGQSTGPPITEADGNNSSGTNASVTTPDGKTVELDFTISTEALAKDPEGTIAQAAKSLGLTIEEAARLVAGVQVPEAAKQGSEPRTIAQLAGGTSPPSGERLAAPNGLCNGEEPSQRPKTPEPMSNAPSFPKPEMGSFMPASSKSVHRAVIDGSKKAPSPFSSKRALQKRGLAKRRITRRESDASQASKRPRRFSIVGRAASTLEEMSEVAPSSPEPAPVDPMDLDDVVDASMLWRGASSKSPSPDAEEDTDDEGDGTDASTARKGRSKKPGINLNAFARWDKIPMGTFRDTQGSSASWNHHQQPLGTFILTRSHAGSSSRRQDQSPFRHSSEAARNSDMFSMSPMRNTSRPPAISTGSDLNGTLTSTTTGRRHSFVVSPVLFPVRSSEMSGVGSGYTGSDLFSSIDVADNNRHARHLATARQDFSSERGGPRKTTRREKRERKARRAAMLASQMDDAASVTSVQSEPSHSPHPGTPTIQTTTLEGMKLEDSDSPSTVLPRMRIIDASPTPRGSPAPPTATVGWSAAPTNSTTLQVPAAPSIQGEGEAGMEKSDMGPPSAIRVTEPLGHLPPSSQDKLQSQADDAASAILPSSACRTPLHSPLFGGIFANFGDDLDDRDGDAILTI
ncbi:hypothetical protein IE53DRAFT_371595 [Violaceomyces palustris]|uniref:Uncharacterized protein n=1 Tax=Violaceomyces palustris TaxID=1673888 RepID=A0ACD0NN71_9BASI|nr:hypothetical protein IE53DRAFT_371595 [Violaceomyces palustris]